MRELHCLLEAWSSCQRRCQFICLCGQGGWLRQHSAPVWVQRLRDLVYAFLPGLSAKGIEFYPMVINFYLWWLGCVHCFVMVMDGNATWSLYIFNKSIASTCSAWLWCQQYILLSIISRCLDNVVRQFYVWLALHFAFIISHGETISRSCWALLVDEGRIEFCTFTSVSPTLYQISYARQECSWVASFVGDLVGMYDHVERVFCRWWL
jgi:hypothetical protein